jgi:membrane protein DedA with SNARE-associated domain
MDVITDFLMSLSQSWWVLPLVTVFATIDGFFPPIPSESVVISLASLFATSHEWPRAALLVGFAALGAFLGDNIAYAIGHFFQPGRWRMFTQGKGRAAYAWATRQFRTKGAPLLFAARYVPVGRVAVNVVAGSVHFRYRQFVLVDACASLTWGLYTTALGLAGGSLVRHNPVLDVVLGMALGIIFGVLVQKVAGKHLGLAGFDVPDAAPVTPASGSADGSAGVSGGAEAGVESSDAAPADPASGSADGSVGSSGEAEAGVEPPTHGDPPASADGSA